MTGNREQGHGQVYEIILPNMQVDKLKQSLCKPEVFSKKWCKNSIIGARKLQMFDFHRFSVSLSEKKNLWAASCYCHTVGSHAKHRLLCSMFWPLNATHKKTYFHPTETCRGTGGVSHNQDNDWFTLMAVTLRRVTASQSGARCTAISRAKRLNEFSGFLFVVILFIFSQ